MSHLEPEPVRRESPGQLESQKPAAPDGARTQTPRDAGGCKNCALMLARIATGRHWWFSWVREPLVLGMRLLAWWNRIDRSRHLARNPDCNGCIRFMKSELEVKSPTFRFLNGLIGDRFSRMRNARLTEEELREAKRYAARASGTAS